MGIFILLILLLNTNNIYGHEISEYIHLDKATKTTCSIIHVEDGDTVYVDKSILKDFKTCTVRLLAIDTPEEDEFLYEESKNFLEKYINQEISLYISKNEECQYEKWDRLLAVLVSGDTIINIKLLEEGYAKRLFLPNDIINFKNFEKKEVESRKNKKGIWKYLGNSKIFITEINPKPNYFPEYQAEFIELYNASSWDINLNGWKIEILGKPYYFKDCIIKACGFLVLGCTQTVNIYDIPQNTVVIDVINKKRHLYEREDNPYGGLDIYIFDNPKEGDDKKRRIQEAFVYNLAWDNFGVYKTGYTLEKIDKQKINEGESSVNGCDDKNWDKSRVINGTPGKDNSVSLFLPLKITEEIIVFPNPFILSKHKFIEFKNLPEGTKVRIYDISLEKVAEFSGRVWIPPSKLSSGIYFYFIESNNLLNKKIGKIVIIK